MNAALGLAGWLAAAVGLGACAILRIQLLRHLEAVARASHELRAPLTALRLGLALAFRDGQLADLRLRSIELELGQATLALEDLTEAWQRPSAVAHSDAVTDGEEFDVAELLAESIEAWRALAAAENVELRLLQPEQRVVVRGRRLRLAQAITNLIANAIEHGGGVVEVSCRVQSAKVIIEVRDEGAGLQATLPELTRPRTPSFLWRRQYPIGSRRGHGLALVSAVAAAHRGRVVAAPCNDGARMLLELPDAWSAEIGHDDLPVRIRALTRVRGGVAGAG